MTTLQYSLLAFGSLFVIVDPLATIPAFLAMTPTDSPANRLRMARLACILAAILLMVFALAGRLVFRFFGITSPAFQMAGSVVLFLVALDMLQAQRSRVHETPEETRAGAAKEDIAITPLAVPMLAGPGAISTVILLYDRASNFTQILCLLTSILLVCTLSFAILALSAHGAHKLNPIVLRLISRLMGLFLVAIAFQFLLNALRELRIIPA
ncbi:MAG: MarC family protein [Limisphaerales bacterium]|jgi:multiple antibiotic resistance protein